ncbi:replication initiation protein [Sulfurimonas sp.]|uniref:replication initiation protein n=2 Tax=Sulfurimonas sp. TaxID=2022749 RepID=UPI003D0EC291
MEYLHKNELNKTLKRFNKIRLYNIYGYMNILPVKYLQKNPNKYIQVQLNTDTHYNAIMMDIDDEELLTEWNAVGLPTPSIQTINKKNNKAHLIWLLNVPVSKKNRKAVKYYKDIVNSIKILIGADKAFQNHQTKNFLNTEQFRVTYNDVAYDLADFKHYIIRDAQYTIESEIETTGSRHIDLFNRLRFYGYRNAKKANFEDLLVARAEKINETFEEPIKTKYIVKSVLKFCEEHKDNFKTVANKNIGNMKFQKISNLSQEEYRKEVQNRQKKSSKRTQDIKRLRSAGKLKVAIETLLRKQIKLSYKNIAKQANLSLSTVKRQAKIIKLFIHNSNGVVRSIRVIATHGSVRATELLSGCKKPTLLKYRSLKLFTFENFFNKWVYNPNSIQESTYD